MNIEEAKALVAEWRSLTPEQSNIWEGHDRSNQIIHCPICHKAVEEYVRLPDLACWVDHEDFKWLEMKRPCSACQDKKDRREYLRDYGPDD